MIGALLLLAAGAPATEEHSANYAYLVCIRDTSLDYARGKESAEAIADAVLARCDEFEPAIHQEWLDLARRNNVGGSLAEDAYRQRVLPETRRRGRGEAIRWVIEFRLPPKPIKSK